MVFEFGMSDIARRARCGPTTTRSRRRRSGSATASRPASPTRLRGGDPPALKHRVTLDRLATALLEKETLDRRRVPRMMGDLPRESRSAETVGTVWIARATPSTLEHRCSSFLRRALAAGRSPARPRVPGGIGPPVRSSAASRASHARRPARSTRPRARAAPASGVARLRPPAAPRRAPRSGAPPDASRPPAG